MISVQNCYFYSHCSLEPLPRSEPQHSELFLCSDPEIPGNGFSLLGLVLFVTTSDNDWSDSAHSFWRNGAVPILGVLGDRLAALAQPLEALGFPFRNTEMRRKELVQRCSSQTVHCMTSGSSFNFSVPQFISQRK